MQKMQLMGGVVELHNVQFMWSSKIVLTLTIPFGTGVPNTHKMYAITTICLEIIENASRDPPLKLKCAFNADVKKWVEFLMRYKPEMNSKTTVT